MGFKVPTLEETLSFLVAMFKGAFPTLNVGSRVSYHWKRLKTIAGAATDIHAHVQSAQRDCAPDTATGDALVRWGNIFGVERNGATPARKSNALRVRGTLAATAAVDEELVHSASGLRFKLAEAAVIPVQLYVDVDVVAIDTGAQTRLLAGEVLEFVSTPAGIQTQAELVLDLDEDGFDQERESAHRVRLLDRIANPSMGGAANDYVAWAREIDTIAAAYCFPSRAGLGTVDVAAFHAGEGATRALSLGEREELLAYLLERAPAGVAGTGSDLALRVLSTDIDPVDVRIAILPNGLAAWEFDWDDSTPPEVLSWTGASRTLRFTTSRPASMKAGDRLSLRGVATVQTGEEFVIEALASTDSVILQTAPAAVPAATDLVYSGGPLVTVIRNAIVAHLNGRIVYADADGPISEDEAETAIDPKILAEGVGPANEEGRFGTWSGDVLHAVLLKIATYHRGVRNGVVELPATDLLAIDNEWPDDDEVPAITHGSVIIHRKW